MPITPFLDGEHFNPETKRVMSVAFELARAALRASDGSDPALPLIAQKIIELAKGGEQNPDRLCEQALTEARRRILSSGHDRWGNPAIGGTTPDSSAPG
jgi:hypothetical protein